MELLIILFLIILNGLFAMAEIAVISVKKTKLEQLASQGNKNAAKALELTKQPSRFLSTIQVGITLVSIFAGAFGGVTLAQKIAGLLENIPLLSNIAQGLAFATVVVIISYLTLIFGELVPKRLALHNTEKIALLIAPFISVFAKFFSPLINLLSRSTDGILSLVGIRKTKELVVSEEEVKMLIKEGAKMGVFEKIEREIVERTLQLGDKKAKALMTARNKIAWIDIKSSLEKIKKELAANPCSYYPVCHDSLDNLLGVVRTEDLLTNFLTHNKIDIKKLLLKPLLIPENTAVLKVLELFKKSGIHMALIINEYGNIAGLISLTNIFEGIVGTIPTVNQPEEKAIIKRSDDSYLIDGLLTIDKFKDFFHIKDSLFEDKSAYQTLGGFVINRLGHIPTTGEKFIFDRFRFEVIDMDGNRVDKILVSLSR